MTEITGKAAVKGKGEGEAILLKELNLLFDLDENKGVVKKNATISNLKNKVLILNEVLGYDEFGTSYKILGWRKKGISPECIIVQSKEPREAVSTLLTICIISDIPLIIEPSEDIFSLAKSGDSIFFDATVDPATIMIKRRENSVHH